MKVYRDIDLKDFEFWAGAKQTVEALTEEELQMVQDALEECYPDGIEDVELNDFLWFYDDYIEDIIDRKLFE